MAEVLDVGTTQVKGRVTGPAGSAEVEFLVDSGAVYSLIPEPVWGDLGLKAKRVERFALADGTHIERSVGGCVVAFPELGETTTPVILGEPGDVALLGVVTLEELGLVLDPLTRKIHHARHLLLRVS